MGWPLTAGRRHRSLCGHLLWELPLNFKYYAVGAKGSSATIGVQIFVQPGVYYAPKWLFNTTDAVPDGTILTLDTQLFFGLTRVTFDNTACGKPEEPIPEEPTP